MAVRAVILDYGEVISLAANQGIHREMIEISGLPEETFEKYYWAYRTDYDAGTLNGRTYWEKIAESAGTRFTPQQIERLAWLDARMWMDLNGAMIAWHGDLKAAGLQTAILSNMGEDVLAAIRSDFSWIHDFDVLVWSCEVGSAKPHPAIYAHAIEKLGLKAEEALFIDNLEENILAARAAGLQGIVFRDIEQLARDLHTGGYEIPLPRAALAEGSAGR
jgi:putative hydrolase of the HAD superfamily